jgi:hypothetical protein
VFEWLNATAVTVYKSTRLPALASTGFRCRFLSEGLALSFVRSP